MTVPNPRSGEHLFDGHHHTLGQVDEIIRTSIPGIREQVENAAIDLAATLAQLREIDPHRESDAHQKLSVTHNMLLNALNWFDRAEDAMNTDDEPPPQEQP